MAVKYQTLEEFLSSPFGARESSSKLSEYNTRYEKYRIGNKIKLNAYTIVGDSYYAHLSIPSESDKTGTVFHDVVIRFFTEDKKIKSESSIRNYYVQFFSNSPGFIYKYAVLYKQKGFLIEELMHKLDPEYANKLPEKTNSNMELSYDSSIYFACRHLSQMKFRFLTKLGMISQKKIDSKKFFSGIKSFQSVKLDSEILKMEKRLMKNANTDRRTAVEDAMIKEDISNMKRSGHRPSSFNKIIPKKSTGGSSSFRVVKKKTTSKRTTRR